MDRDLRGSPLWAEVEEYFTKLHSPGLGKISNATDLNASPDGIRIAFTGIIRHSLEDAPTTRICILYIAENAVQVVTSGPGNQRLPQWAPNGCTLAFLDDHEGEHTIQLIQMYMDDRLCYTLRDGNSGGRVEVRPLTTIKLEISVEYLYFSPAGLQILIGAYAVSSSTESSERPVEKAEIRSPKPDWLPVIETGTSIDSPWRGLWIIEVGSKKAQHLTCHDKDTKSQLNIWEANWCTDDRIVCIISDTPSEGSWYMANLAIIQIDSGAVEVIYKPKRQLSTPICSASGKQAAVIEGLASDRGGVSGDVVLIDTFTKTYQRIATGQVDIMNILWPEEDCLLTIGSCGLDMLAGVVSIANDTFTELWSTSESLGYYHTWLGNNTFAVVLESWTRYPEIAVISHHSASTVTSFSHKGAHWLSSELGEGLGYLPKNAVAPYPLILNAHGGPVFSFRNEWLGNDYTTVLVSRGYAVLNVNPRGSSGRGQEFAEHIISDFGGLETEDFLSGIVSLKKRGLIDPSRIGITGSSHGGFQAASIVTSSDLFAASVPIAAITDWNDMYSRSSISPDFMNLFFPSRIVFGLASRSPLLSAGTNPTPVLLIAGQEDDCVPPGQAVAYQQACKRKGVESVAVVYPGEGHGIIRKWPACLDMCVRVVSWFERFMPPDAKDNKPTEA